MEKDSYIKKIYVILLYFSFILTGFLCKTLSSVLIPVVSATLLAFVFYPVIKVLKVKAKIPWVISTIIIVFLIFFFFVGLSSLLVKSLTTIFSEYPRYETKLMSIYKILSSRFGLAIDEEKSFFTNMWQHFQVRNYVQKAAMILSSGVLGFGKNLVTILLLLVFLLLEMRYFNKTINNTFVNKKGTIQTITKDIIEDTTRYLSIKFFVSLVTGIAVYLLCLVTGLDFAIVWAFFAFIMNFIPYFGSFLSVGLTSLFAVVQFYPNSIFKIIVILIFMIGINFVVGNIVEPKIEGKNLDLSPFAILISLSIWGYIWGFIGMLFAVPVTVILKIICENVELLHPIGILLGDKKPRTEKKDKQVQNETETDVEANPEN